MQANSANRNAPVAVTGLKYNEGIATTNLQLIEVDEAFLEQIFSNENRGETDAVAHIKMT